MQSLSHRIFMPPRADILFFLRKSFIVHVLYLICLVCPSQYKKQRAALKEPPFIVLVQTIILLLRYVRRHFAHHALLLYNDNLLQDCRLKELNKLQKR